MGIDVGSSMIKAVAVTKSGVIATKMVVTGDASESAQLVLKAVVSDAGKELEDVLAVAVTGGGAHLVGDTILGLSTTRVDEIKAVGLGALKLSGKKNALVVNMGTGTSLIVASDDGRKIEHIGGTAVGGGTIEGLGRRMLGKSRFKDLEKMANGGNTNNIDLTVEDVEGGPVGILPQNATASNFKKLDIDSDGNDVAAAIFNMVSEVIGVVASMAARAYHDEEDIVLVGNLIQSKRIADGIESVMKLFHMKVCIPKNGEFCAAIGAAESIM